ncbi:hypothetical protein [Roseovarius albus]|uniref:hypothetical protein n=1 Tax=Roseovarius albus TaxID=1247867 RepID=UPI000A26A125|nr:hypothetical protein [Roseovarius albus]
MPLLLLNFASPEMPGHITLDFSISGGATKKNEPERPMSYGDHCTGNVKSKRNSDDRAIKNRYGIENIGEL